MYLAHPRAQKVSRIPFLLGYHLWWYPNWINSHAAEAAWEAAHWAGIRISALWGRPGLRAYCLGRSQAFWESP